jgi:hypothetical protein
MEKVIAKTTTYAPGDDWRIDIVETDDEFEAWLWKDAYGHKTFMWGEPKQQTWGTVTRKEFVHRVEVLWEDYVIGYMNEVEDLETAAFERTAGMHYTYSIYQVKAKEDFAFMKWESAQKHGWSFGAYESVWNGEKRAKDDHDLLESLFEGFNLYRPDEFRGHSMSVSDIVGVCDNHGNTRYYYCDSFGWKDITGIVETK